jgi:hypothetical protein
MNNVHIMPSNPTSIPNPKNGAFIKHNDIQFVTLYNHILDTYGIYIVNDNWSNIYWCPPSSYIFPSIDWDKIWIEMDYSIYGYYRPFIYSLSINGPEICFNNSKL